MKIGITFIFISIFCINTFCQVIQYHPNKHWHIPGHVNIPTDSSFSFRYISPQYTYPSRMTNGTWENNIWKNWISANHMTTPYKLNGHSWHKFVHKYKELFLAHPEYLAEIKGQRVGYGKTSKFCVSNKALQKLYVSYVVEEFVKLKNDNASISVEPSDGAGYCTCSKCKRIGSISNQVFLIANIAAKAIRGIHPQGKVNLLAYFLHAPPPDFPLESNVHVTVVPNGFQTEFDPDELLFLWSKKAKILTCYEYIGIPQWYGEMPKVNVPVLVKRIKLCKKLGYQGFWHEVGLNINNTIILQLMSQIWKDPELEWNHVFDKFIQDCFPSSQIPMKRLFTRWHNTWLGKDEIPAFLYDLDEAFRLAKEENEKKRVLDIVAYGHYIIEYQEWRPDINNDTASLNFFHYLFNTNNRLIINPSAISSVFYDRMNNKNLKDQFSFFHNKDWSFIKLIEDSDMLTILKEDIKKYGKEWHDYKYINANEVIGNALNQNFKFLESYTIKVKKGDSFYIYSDNIFSVETHLLNDYKETRQARITIFDDNFNDFYIKEYSLGKNITFSLKPRGKLSKITYYASKQSEITIKGKFLLVFEKKRLLKQDNINYIFTDSSLQPVSDQDVREQNSGLFFLFRK